MAYQVHTIEMRMSQAYLIETVPGLVLVDAGNPGDEGRVLSKMKTIGRDDLRLIFITHAHLDHYGCAAALRSLTGAPISIHQADAEPLALGQTRLGTMRGRGRLLGLIWRWISPRLKPDPAPADILLEDGDDLGLDGLGAMLLHTPGHTFGSSCLVIEHRLAFAGDLLTNRGKPRLQRYYAEDWSLLPGSLRRLQAARPEWVYPGHGREPISARDLERMNPAKSGGSD